MPSTRVANAVGGGGILRRKDGVIIDLKFTKDNPLWKDSGPRVVKAGEKASDFVPLFGVFTILEDGKEAVTLQPAKVGSVDDYEIVCDGRGLKGSRPLNKGSQFMILYSTLVNPTDGGTGFDESLLPEDPGGLVADYSNLRGARVMFDWQKDETKWAKANPRKAKDKDGKPVVKDGKPVTYDRENLVIAAYYGQQDLAKLNVPTPAKTTTGKPATTSGAKASKTAAAVDANVVAAVAEEHVQAALRVAKNRTLTRNKLSMKLLNSMAALEDNLREAVRTYALDGKNLASIDDVTFDGGTDMVTLAEGV